MKRLLVILLLVMLAIFSVISSSSADAFEISTIEVGSTVYFGGYFQSSESNTEKTAVEWVVLERNNNRVTLLSKKILDFHSFDTSDEKSVLWADSGIRSWLNGDFYDAVFSDEDKKAIVPVGLKTTIAESKKISTTKDVVYLLDSTEITYYFDAGKTNNKPNSRYKYVDFTTSFQKAEPTSYAVKSYLGHNPEKGESAPSNWLLRSAFKDSPGALLFDNDSLEQTALTTLCGIRPVVVVDLKKIVPTSFSKHQPFLEANPSSLAALTNPLKAEQETYPLEISLSFKANLIFSRYDVELFLDNERLALLKHGEDYSNKISVSPGKHTITFYKADDHRITKSLDCNVYDDTRLYGHIYAKRNEVDTNGIRIFSRYNIADAKILKYLRDYDNVLANLKQYYGSAYRYSKQITRRTKEYEKTYFFFGRDTKGVLYFKVPHSTGHAKPVDHSFGVYEGDLKTGSVTIYLENGRTLEMDHFVIHTAGILDEDYSWCSFDNACEEFIIEVLPEIYKREFDVMYYLRKNDKELYKLIFPDGP